MSSLQRRADPLTWLGHTRPTTIGAMEEHPTNPPKPSALPQELGDRFVKGLLGFSALGLAEWFFGNAYEQIVLVPNFATGDSSRALLAYREFFKVSNPAFYYVPLNQLALIALVLALVWTRKLVALQRLIQWAVGFSLMATLLTAYIVKELNLRLFFGELPADPELVHSLARSWAILNPVRMVLVAISFFYTFLALTFFCAGRAPARKENATSEG